MHALTLLTPTLWYAFLCSFSNFCFILILPVNFLFIIIIIFPFFLFFSHTSCTLFLLTNPPPVPAHNPRVRGRTVPSWRSWNHRFAERCIRSSIPHIKLVNTTPMEIMNKIPTNSLHNVGRHIKEYYLSARWCLRWCAIYPCVRVILRGRSQLSTFMKAYTAYAFWWPPPQKRTLKCWFFSMSYLLTATCTIYTMHWYIYVNIIINKTFDVNTLTAKDGDFRLSAPNACLPKTEISVFVVLSFKSTYRHIAND